MDGSRPAQFFLQPKLTFQRRYEALRAIFVDDEPIDRVAQRFAYKPSALRSMASRFRADCRRGVAPPFFAPMDEGDRPAQAPAWAMPVRGRPKSPTVAG